jgi:hypothetical protein
MEYSGSELSERVGIQEKNRQNVKAYSPRLFLELLQLEGSTPAAEEEGIL